MKMSPMSPCSRKRIALWWLILSLVGSNGYSTIVIHPSPGDLSSVEHLRESQDYAVTVNGRSCFVYETDNYWNHPQRKLSDRVSFVYFDFDGEPATVEVTCKFPADSVTIRPKSDAVSFTRNGNRIAFTLSEPKQLSLEVNDRKRPLFIFGDKPEEPDTSAQHYFKPGVHHVGAKFPIKANERVYIAGGAVVEGTLLCQGGNLKIRGRGILSAGQWTWEQWLKDKQLSLITDTTGGDHNHHEYSGIIMLNSPGWFVNGYGGHRNFLNLKVIGWVGNTDGPHLNGDGAFENSFVFNNDDSLITNRGNNNTFRNCVVWKGPWGRPIVSLMPNNQENVLYEDIDIIADERANRKFGMIGIHGAKRAYKRNYTFRNIRIEGPTAAALLYFDASGSKFSNILLEHIAAEDLHGYEGRLSASNGGSLHGVRIKDLRMKGKIIESLSHGNIQVDGAVTGVTFNN